MDRIRKISKIMYGASFLSGGASIIVLFVFCFFPGRLENFALHSVKIPATDIMITLYTRLACFTVSLVPLSILLSILYHSKELFRSYYAGEIFSNATSRRLRKISLFILLLAFVRPLFKGALAFVVTSLSGVDPLFYISLSLNDLFSFFFSFFMLAVSFVMEEATRISDENKEFI